MRVPVDPCKYRQHARRAIFYRDMPRSDQQCAAPLVIRHVRLERARCPILEHVIAMKSNPARIAEMFDVSLPRLRNRLTMPEQAEFPRLRRGPSDFIKEAADEIAP